MHLHSLKLESVSRSILAFTTGSDIVDNMYIYIYLSLSLYIITEYMYIYSVEGLQWIRYAAYIYTYIYIDTAATYTYIYIRIYTYISIYISNPKPKEITKDLHARGRGPRGSQV